VTVEGSFNADVDWAAVAVEVHGPGLRLGTLPSHGRRPNQANSDSGRRTRRR
jgi:hypothetical protein